MPVGCGFGRDEEVRTVRPHPSTAHLGSFLTTLAVGALLVACSGAVAAPSFDPVPAAATPSPAPSTAAAAGSSAKGAFHLEKTCAGYVCTVTASSYSGIPVGTTITYSGSGMDALTADIKVAGGTATGQCSIATLPGTCTFAKGTGSLAAFHGDVVVTQNAAGLWMWDGPTAF